MYPTYELGRNAVPYRGGWHIPVQAIYGSPPAPPPHPKDAVQARRLKCLLSVQKELRSLQ